MEPCMPQNENEEPTPFSDEPMVAERSAGGHVHTLKLNLKASIVLLWTKWTTLQTREKESNSTSVDAGWAVGFFVVHRSWDWLLG